MTKKNNHRKYSFYIIFLVLLVFSMAISYFVSIIINNNFNEIPLIVLFGINNFLFFFIVYTIFLIFGRIHLRRKHSNTFTPLLEAIENISKGNFDILIDQKFPPRLNELVESINKMAKELGTMEQLRQDFISNVSHEFQSPLTSIQGYSSLLKKKVKDEDLLKYINIISDESKRLSKLSENLLRLSALEDDDSKIIETNFRLDRQIENIILLLEPQWKEKEIIPDISLEKITYLGDEDLLKQVWINLIGNAIKFTPERGLIKIILKSNEKNVVVTISDNGMGISKTDQMRIFERFYKVDKARNNIKGGSGLGLALVKKILNMHDGEISLVSEENVGTTFKISLKKV